GWAGPLHGRGVGPHRARLGNVFLHVEPWIVFERLSSLGIEALGPVQLVRVLAAFDEAAVAAIERIEEAVAAEMAHDLARLAVDRHVVELVDADLIIVPRFIR